MRFAAIKNSQMVSNIDDISIIGPQEKRSGRLIAAGLMLTSLVDVFSILVIYLIYNSGSAEFQVNLSKEIQLPMTSRSSALKAGVSVRIVDGKYIIDEKTFSESEVVAELSRLKELNDEKSGHLIIQADKDADFNLINPLLVIASQAKFESIKFATIEGIAK